MQPSPNFARSPTKSNGGYRPPRRSRARAARRAAPHHALGRRHGVARELPPQGRKGLAPRNPGAHPAVRPPPGQATDPAHGQSRRLRRAPRATYQGRIRQSRRGDLKLRTSGCRASGQTVEDRGAQAKTGTWAPVLEVEAATSPVAAASRRRSGPPRGVVVSFARPHGVAQSPPTAA